MSKVSIKINKEIEEEVDMVEDEEEIEIMNPNGMMTTDQSHEGIAMRNAKYVSFSMKPYIS